MQILERGVEMGGALRVDYQSYQFWELARMHRAAFEFDDLTTSRILWGLHSYAGFGKRPATKPIDHSALKKTGAGVPWTMDDEEEEKIRARIRSQQKQKQAG